MVRITYAQEKIVPDANEELTILEISKQNFIPHVHECGGNAECSTCRIIVLDNLENVLPRNEKEAALAKQKGFEPNIRLACQTRVCGPVTIRRLVLDDADMEVALAETGKTTGRHAEVAVLFSDIRGFTPFVERSLPYDVIHILNRYLHSMGEAVLKNGGFIDKYIGDGMMAMFGVFDCGRVAEWSAAEKCIRAVKAGLDMLSELTRMNVNLEKYFNYRIRIGIGIHIGSVLVGEIGHPKKMQFTALGDAVNLASRIETATKSEGVNMLVSEDVYTHIKDKVKVGKITDSTIPGKSGLYRLYEILA